LSAGAERQEPNEIFEEPFDIERANPTKVSVDHLRKSLHKVGLTCEQTSNANLEQYVAEVRRSLPAHGTNEAFFIGVREPVMETASPEAISFIEDVCSPRVRSLGDVREVAAGHEGADAFYDHILADNPGGVEFANLLAGAEWGQPHFATAFAQRNPSGVELLASLAQRNVTVASKGTWVPGKDGIAGKSAGYLTELVHQERFDLLEKKAVKNERPNCHQGEQPDKRWGITGYRNEDYHKELDNADAVKEQYKILALNASAAIVGGIDKDNLESFLTNEVSPYTDSSAEDYDSTKFNGGKHRELLLFLAKDPQGSGSSGTNSGLGVLSVMWRLRVKKYKVKKAGAKHDTTMEVWLRSIIYPSVYDPDASPPNTTTVLKQVKDDIGLVGKRVSERQEPNEEEDLTVFGALPPATKQTFDKSVVIKSDSTERLAAVLYAPDLQNIGAIDNTGADAAVTYTKAVTEGFTLGTAITISAEYSAEVNVMLAKATLKVGLSISFTAQYNKSTTESTSFVVPAGKKAFLYQGYLRTRVLRHDPKAQTYSWMAGEGQFLTNTVRTSPTPAVGAATFTAI